MRSAYTLIQAKLISSVGECSNAQNMKSLWNAIWGLRIPPKVKILAWGLPTHQQLYQIHVRCAIRVITDKTCALCRFAEEDIVHALISCPSIKSFWAPHITTIATVQEAGCSMSLILAIKEQDLVETLEIFFIISWSF